MSHRWDCPTRWNAERQGERAFERGDGSWSNPYARQPGQWDNCRDAERAWEDGRRSAERREEEHRIEARQQRQRAEQRQWEEQARWAERQQYEEDRQYEAAMEAAYYDQLFEDHLIETIDLPRWEDDGGRAHPDEGSKR